MAGKPSIGATLVLKEGKFFTTAQKATAQTSKLKTSFGEATAKLKENGGAMDVAGNKMSSMAKKVVGVVAAYAGFKQIKQFTQDCLAAADDQYKAEARLEQLMGNVKGTTNEQIDAVKEYASALQQLTTVDDEAAMTGASQLATFQLQADSIQQLMPALNDLAVGTYGVNVSQEQMQQSANLLGKVFTGQVGALRRVGVAFDKNQEKILTNGTEAEKTATLVAVLKQNYGGLAEKMAETPTGRIVQLKNAWGDVQEEIGVKLYPLLTNFFGWLAQKVPVIRDMIMGVVDKVSPHAQKAIDAMKTGCEMAGTAIRWVADNWSLLGPVLGGVVAAITAVTVATGIYKGIQLASVLAQYASAAATGLQVTTATAATAAQMGLNTAMLASPITWIILGVVALIAGVVALIANWDKLKQKFPGLIGGAENLFGAIKEGVLKVWNVIKPVIDKVWGAIKAVIEKLKPLFTAIGQNITRSFQTAVDVVSGIFNFWAAIFRGDWQGAWDIVKGIFSKVWEQVKSIFTNVFNALDQITGGKLTAIGEKIGAVMNKIKTVVSDVWTGITSIIKGAVNGVIKAINWMIKGLNGLKFEIPNWVPGDLGGKTFGLNIPVIPMLAKGGTIRRAGSVLVGEQGPEILNLNRGASVVPLGHGGGTINHNQFYITIDAGDRTDESAVNELVSKLKLVLSNM